MRTAEWRLPEICIGSCDSDTLSTRLKKFFLASVAVKVVIIPPLVILALDNVHEWFEIVKHNSPIYLYFLALSSAEGEDVDFVGGGFAEDGGGGGQGRAGGEDIVHQQDGKFFAVGIFFQGESATEIFDALLTVEFGLLAGAAAAG